MSDYPGAIDSFRTLENDPGITYDASKTKVVYAEDQTQRSDAIVAIEETLGTNPQGAYSTVKAWLNALVTAIAGKQDSLGFTPEDVANKSTNTSLGTSDTLYASQKAVKTYVDNAISTAVAAAKSAMYPVGSIYFNKTDNTNPATLLGFGTWAAVEARFLVGYKSGDADFGTLDSTGGERTHLLTGAESGTSVHNHGITDPGHLHGYHGVNSASGNNGSQWPWVADVHNRDLSTDSATTGISVNNSSAANASSAHNTLPVYRVVMMWVRTA